MNNRKLRIVSFTNKYSINKYRVTVMLLSDRKLLFYAHDVECIQIDSLDLDA